jgi:PAS domain S-box-containing protein
MGEQGEKVLTGKGDKKSVSEMKNVNKMKVKRSLLLYVVPTAITIGSLLPTLVIPHTYRVGKLFNEPLHSTIEAIGAFASIVIAWILFQEKDEKYNEKYFLFSMGFFTMGLFDSFHAVTAQGKGFVLSRSIAELSGGFWFALVWLPRSVVVRIAGWKKWLPFFVAAGSVLFGIWILLFSETLTMMVKDGIFTTNAITISHLAGVCFLTAAGRLMIDFRHSYKTEIYLITCILLLFGLSSLVFASSHVWSPYWWWRHLLRLLAYLLVVGLLTNWYLKKISDLQEQDKKLEDMGMELSLGLSEAFEGLNKVASGDPRSRISEVSENELIAKLKQAVNKTAEGIETIVNQSHEFAIGLAEHFDVLHRVSKGNLNARISESSQDELLKALGKVTNQMIESVSREITERKKAEESLRESEEKYRSLVENIPDVTWMADQEGKIMFISPSVENVCGYTPEEIYEAGDGLWFERIHPDNVGQVKEMFELLFTKGNMFDIEYRIQRKDGKWIWLRNRASIIHGKDGVLFAEGLARDINRRKKAEEDIRRLNEELEQRVLQRTLQLELANKELEAFSYSVSHDLRAPLRAIDGFSRILLEDYGDKYDAEGKRLLNIVRSNTQKMGELIDDLLALSRLGRKEIDVSDIDMDSLVKGLMDELGLDTDKRKLQFNFKPLPPAFGDMGMIRQVFANFLLNAVKFTKLREPAVIEIGGYNEDSKNIYYVKDNGVGFDMRYKDKLFGVFQRLHNGEEFEGTGIGLAIAQRIMSRHDGQIWAEGKVNEGATFYFALPLKGRKVEG